MTNELVELIPGLVSGSDLSNKANLYHVVKLSAANTVALAGAVSDMLLGVLVNCPAAGEAAAVAGPGSIVGCVAGGLVSAGDYITTDGTGQGVKANPAAAANNNVVGIALTGASSGACFTLLVLPQRIQG